MDLPQLVDNSHHNTPQELFDRRFDTCRMPATVIQSTAIEAQQTHA